MNGKASGGPRNGAGSSGGAGRVRIVAGASMNFVGDEPSSPLDTSASSPSSSSSSDASESGELELEAAAPAREEARDAALLRPLRAGAAAALAFATSPNKPRFSMQWKRFLTSLSDLRAPASKALRCHNKQPAQNEAPKRNSRKHTCQAVRVRCETNGCRAQHEAHAATALRCHPSGLSSAWASSGSRNAHGIAYRCGQAHVGRFQTIS